MNNSHHEALYEALFDTTPDGIMIVSEDGRTIELNASMCRFLRAPREQLVGRHFRDFIPPERVDEAFTAFAKLKSEGTLAVEFPMRAIDGTIINLEWRSRANFVPGLHLCIARDLTTRERAKNGIARSSRTAAKRSGVSSSTSRCRSHSIPTNRSIAITDSAISPNATT